MINKLDIKSMTLEDLSQYIEGLNEKKFRAKQIYSWLHSKQVDSFDEMSNISNSLRNKLKETSYITELKEVTKLESKDGTIKYLFELDDENVIESVFMKYKHGNSVCISSQVGCKMGCNFCASTIGGLVRQLSASEMLEQIYKIQKLSGEKVTNVVIMGTGEPLDNYDALINFIRIITSSEGLNISQRNITVSTCGIIDKINKLAEENFKITLAISLHAPNNNIRKKIMPVAAKYEYNDLINACKHYVDSTKRRITFEYSLIKDVNDSKECARELSKVLKGLLCHVNLIPVNTIEERNYSHSNNDTIQAFKKTLENNNINVTIRRELGSDIDAACGQLRRKHMK